MVVVRCDPPNTSIRRGPPRRRAGSASEGLWLTKPQRVVEREGEQETKRKGYRSRSATLSDVVLAAVTERGRSGRRNDQSNKEAHQRWRTSVRSFLTKSPIQAGTHEPRRQSGRKCVDPGSARGASRPG